jgi:hypothetical protein
MINYAFLFLPGSHTNFESLPGLGDQISSDLARARIAASQRGCQCPTILQNAHGQHIGILRVHGHKHAVAANVEVGHAHFAGMFPGTKNCGHRLP